jgi:DNA-binding Lrp family transcriptional regulator
MSEKEKTAKEMREELNLFVLLKEKEIEFLERITENGIKFLPQEERELTINMFDEIIQEKKKELEVVQGMINL